MDVMIGLNKDEARAVWIAAVEQLVRFEYESTPLSPPFPHFPGGKEKNLTENGMNFRHYAAGRESFPLVGMMQTILPGICFSRDPFRESMNSCTSPCF